MIVLRFVRRLLAMMIRLLLLNRIVTVGLLALLLFAVVGVPLLSNAAALGNPAGTPQSNPSSQQLAAGLSPVNPSATQAPDPAVETYIKGMTTFDANLMWSALHPSLKQQMQTQGASVEMLKTQLAQMKAAGVTYDKVTYIGGYVGTSGYRYYFYVISHTGIVGSGQAGDDYHAFTVAPDGGGIISMTTG